MRDINRTFTLIEVSDIQYASAPSIDEFASYLIVVGQGVCLYDP